MKIHHQRPNGWTACGRSPDRVQHDSGVRVESVTCLSCLRSLEAKPAAHPALLDYACGMRVELVAERHWITVATLHRLIREAL